MASGETGKKGAGEKLRQSESWLRKAGRAVRRVAWGDGENHSAGEGNLEMVKSTNDNDPNEFDGTSWTQKVGWGLAGAAVLSGVLTGIIAVDAYKSDRADEAVSTAYDASNSAHTHAQLAGVHAFENTLSLRAGLGVEKPELGAKSANGLINDALDGLFEEAQSQSKELGSNADMAGLVGEAARRGVDMGLATRVTIMLDGGLNEENLRGTIDGIGDYSEQKPSTAFDSKDEWDVGGIIPYLEQHGLTIDENKMKLLYADWARQWSDLAGSPNNERLATKIATNPNKVDLFAGATIATSDDPRWGLLLSDMVCEVNTKKTPADYWGTTVGQAMKRYGQQTGAKKIECVTTVPGD